MLKQEVEIQEELEPGLFPMGLHTRFSANFF